MAVVTRLELKGRNGLDKYDKYPIAVNIPVSLNYNLADVRNPDQRKASFSKTINLNGTNEINKLFENIFSVNVATQYFNKNLKTPVRYIVNEIENFSGDLQLIKININPDNSIVYECSIVGAGGSLFIDIGEKYITGNANTIDDLDFSAYNHNYTRANQIASRTTYLGTGTGYVYPLIDRGTNGGSDVIWNVKDFLPCFSIYEYITKIIAATGRTFTSTFLNTAEFKKLYCYPNIDKIELTQTQLDNKQFYIGKGTGGGGGYPTSLMTLNSKFIFNLDNESSSPFFDGGGQYSNPVATIATNGTYNITSIQVFNIGWSSTNPLAVESRWTNLAIKSSIEISNDGGTTWTELNSISSKWKNQTVNRSTTDFQWTQSLSTGSIYITAGTMLRMTATRYQIPGTLFNPNLNAFNYGYYDTFGNVIPGATGTFTISYESFDASGTPPIINTAFYCLSTIKEISEGEPLAANNLLPTKIKQKDFFKSVVQAFNLYVDVDKDNENNLIIETFDEFYNADIVDYENRTDLAKEQSINPNLLEGKRYIYAYKNDVDYYNTLYQDRWNESYGTQQIDVENDFIRSDKKSELIFSATPNVANYGMAIAHPRIYKKDGTTIKSFAPNIRMLYCAVKTSFDYTYNQQGELPLLTNEYLYAGMEDDPFNPTYSLAFDFPKEVYYNYVQAQFTNNNLYNRYHKNYLKNLIDKDAKFVTKYLWLNEKDIYLFNFRNRLFIDGAYYIVNKIENYNPLELTSTKVELVKLLETDVFTPTSVLISEDTGINAGQDIQNYRLNSSLNVGTNIQNRGTNCLAVGNNIVIPASCSNVTVIGDNITIEEDTNNFTLNNFETTSTVLNSKAACKSVSANYNVLAFDDLILVTTAATNKTITLQYLSTDYLQDSVSYDYSGFTVSYLLTKVITIKKVDSGAGNVIIDGYRALIDGAATITLTAQYQSVRLQFDGTNWNKI